MKHEVWLSLGSNLDRERVYPQAVRLIASFCEVLAASPVYETEPVGMPGAAPFFNGALRVATDLAPEAFKQRLMDLVEVPLGRVRVPGDRYRPRTIDVDIALWDDAVGEILGRALPDPDILRHLHLARPLADLDPRRRHPQTGRPLGEIAAELEAAGPVPVPRPDIVLEY